MCVHVSCLSSTKKQPKKPSYLIGHVSERVTNSSIHFFQEKKQKNILYRKGFEYQPSLSLSNPQLKRPYFLGGNVAGLAVTKITLCRKSFPAALPPLEIYATDMPYASKQNIAFWRGGAHPAPRCGSWTGFQTNGWTIYKFWTPSSEKMELYIYIRSLIIPFIMALQFINR